MSFEFFRKVEKSLTKKNREGQLKEKNCKEITFEDERAAFIKSLGNNYINSNVIAIKNKIKANQINISDLSDTELDEMIMFYKRKLGNA